VKKKKKQNQYGQIMPTFAGSERGKTDTRGARLNGGGRRTLDEKKSPRMGGKTVMGEQ